MLVEHRFLTCGKPSDVEGETRTTLEQLPDAVAGEAAQHRRGQRFDRVIHIALHRRLNADEVARQCEARDLAAPVVQGLVAERPAFEQRKQLVGGAAFLEHRRRRPGAQLSHLQRRDKVELLVANGVKDLADPERALRARNVVAEG